MYLLASGKRPEWHSMPLSQPDCTQRSWFMRISLSSLALVLCFLSFAREGNGQSMDQKITVSFRNTPLKQAILQLEALTGFGFTYRSSDIEGKELVNYSVTNAPFSTVLYAMLKARSLTFVEKDGTILIKKALTAMDDEKVVVTSVAWTPIDTTVKGHYVLKGRVVSTEREEPIANATVAVTQTGYGTTTDADGYFSLRIPAGVKLISFSHVNYNGVGLAPNERNMLVRLTPHTQMMSATVTTGLFKRPKENFTGSATTISGDQLKQVNMVNPLQALKVFDPSVRIPDNVQFGSDPNRLPNITLRGTNSFPQVTTATNGASGADFMANYGTNPNQPLFILDGFEVSLQKIYDLDINRIANFTILKDAAATSVYGSRAANGVIIVDTKQPAPGKLRVNYSGMMQVAAPDLTVYNLLNAREKLEVERLGGLYNEYATGQRPDGDAVLRQTYAGRLSAIDRGVNTYWLAQPVRTGFGQRHSVYIDGGDNYIRYGLELGYNNNAGVMKNSNRRNYMVGMNISYRYRGLLFKNVLSVEYNKATNSNYGNFSEYTRLNPYWSPYDSTGKIARILEIVRDPLNPTAGFTNYFNPLYNSTLNTINTSQYTNLINQTNLEWNIGSGFRLTGRMGITRQTDQSDLFLPAQHTSFDTVADFTRRGSYKRGNGSFFSYDGSMQLDYSKIIGRGQLYATAGAGIAQTNSDATTLQVLGFPNQRLDQLVFGNAYPADSRPSGNNTVTRRFSSFVNGSYSYLGRYQADVSISADGSSQFGTDKRVAPFWSAGLSWNLHKEAFVKAAAFADVLRLRATLGTTGSNRFEPFQGITSYTYYTDQNYRGQVGAVLAGYGNTNLQWQQTLKRNIGVDMTLFKSRLNIRFDIYRENTSSLILDITTPPSVGVNSYKENVGELENNGYEFTMNYFVIKQDRKRLFWSVFVNGAHNADRIKSISNSLKKQNEENDKNSTNTSSADYNKQVSPQYSFQEGQSVNAIWAVPSLGIDPSNGREVFRKLDGSLTYDWNARDKVITGNEIPKLQGNFGTNLSYKGWALGVYFSYQLGAKMYNQTLADRVENANLTWQVDRRVLEGRWKQPGDVTFYKGLVFDNGREVTGSTYVTSRFVQTNNFVNLTSVSLSYQVPDKLTKMLRLQNTRFTLLANDVKRWSSITVERGLDYPFARNFTLNLSTSF